jgi:hypothetical protein
MSSGRFDRRSERTSVTRRSVVEKWRYEKLPSRLQADAVVYGAPKPLLAPLGIPAKLNTSSGGKPNGIPG